MISDTKLETEAENDGQKWSDKVLVDKTTKSVIIFITDILKNIF